MRKLLSAFVVLFCAVTLLAEGTRTWEQSKFEEFEKGTPKGVAIRSDGTLVLAPAFKSLFTSPSTYIWSVASDEQAVYAAAGAPARVYRVTPDGQSSVIFAPSELQVQALAIGPDGAIYAATSPDGKVYKIARSAAPQIQPTADKQTNVARPPAQGEPGSDRQGRVTVDPNYSASVFFDPKTKYIWALAFDRDGRLYVATGDRGEIFRVDKTGTSSVFFKSEEAHIRALAFDPQGNLIAGSDGSGLVYRISPTGEGFVLYSAPKKEITALAVDAQGNIYASGAGDKRGQIERPVVPVMPSPAQPATINIGGGQSAPVAPVTIAQIPLPGLGATGSEVYRIAPDGSPRRVWSSREDLVYALALDQDGTLLAGTGNKGRIYAIQGPGQFTDLLKASASQVIGFAKGPRGGLYVATSNLGKIFMLQESDEREGTYESDVFDARIFSRWGRAEVRSRGNVELFARSGNVDNPDRNWSPWKKVDLQKDPVLGVPSARYVQWRAVLHSGNPAPSVESVRVNYLSKNVAPEIDDVTVQVGYRYPAIPRSGPPPVSNDGQTILAPPPPATKDKDSIAVRWTARDENDDQLTYSIYYRGDNETRWKLLKDGITDRYYSFDSSLLPDGGYTLRVVASDAPSHSPDEALTASKESSRFEVDTTPPVVQNLQAVIENGQIHVTFSATDSFSVVDNAEFSVDAGDWQYVAPVGEISDARQENYDFTAPIPPVKPDASEPPVILSAPEAPQGQSRDKRKKPTATAAPVANTAPEEHVVVVRVYDRFDNMGSAKVVVRGR